jgi:predicted NACHT family NTPase
VELRYYETSILDLITAFLHRHDPSLSIDSDSFAAARSADRVKELLRQGNFFLLIDGVNELPSPEAQPNLQKFRQDYQQTTPMIFTTRDLGVGGDLGIDKKLEMQPLTETQMGEFVRGYLPETGEQMLQQLGGRLREFEETPLLLMMLCSVFASNGNQIPPNLGSVFRRFTEIYDRQIKQDIPVTDESRRWWKRLLQHLAWTMMGGNVPRRGKQPFALSSIPPTEFLIAIPRHQAEEIFTAYLEGTVLAPSHCCEKIQNLYSKIQLLNRQQIDVDLLYVDVSVLQNSASDSNATIPGLLKNSNLRNDFDRLGLNKRDKRSPGFDAAMQYSRLMVLGKPGSGKTTFLRHLAVANCKGLFLGEFLLSTQYIQTAIYQTI